MTAVPEDCVGLTSITAGADGERGPMTIVMPLCVTWAKSTPMQKKTNDETAIAKPKLHENRMGCARGL